ncbi:hypothetical protein [Fulvivirga lutimaris]|uniref:hypothetical protein n=1 Tax=Fulvivirga lutimaris TaxID=1819566 RepID=UPI0012BD0D20|nr:hypothetical protein [Fulvivirga lutimaris]MTI41195.1 hypothetical protein [Fulvivirga lutimaris]
MVGIDKKFEEGDIVYEVTSPQQLMLITRQQGSLYYCKRIEHKNDRLTAFMGRDLKGFHAKPEVILNK